MTTLAKQRPGWVDGLTPTPIKTVSDWADENRILNQASSAEPGRYRTARTPYLRQPMNDLSDHSDVQDVTLMFAAQVGKTEAGNNWVAYTVDHAPGPGMVVQPTTEMAKLWSRQRFARMIEDMPCLNEKIKDSRSRDSGNTTLLKEFPGGMWRASGANSGASLRSMPVKNLMLDEIDAYPHDVDGEGDPVELAENRTKTFARKKRLKTSTPTEKGISRVERQFKSGTMSYYYVPCPDCGEKQRITLQSLKWEKDENGELIPESVMMACNACGVLIPEYKKTWMLDNGEWIDTKENAKHKSYQLGSFYSPVGWESWSEIVAKYLRAVGDVELMKTFVNTVEGLPYEEKSKKVEPHILEQRAKDYPLGCCPADCLALTAGVDVQDNRIEIYVVGFNGRQRWIIDHSKIWGNPSLPEIWVELDDYLTATFEHERGAALSISSVAIDSGGHHTSEVYDFCRVRKSRHIIAIKGSSQKGKPIIGKPSKVDINLHGETMKNGGEVWPVGTDTAKDKIYNALGLTDDQDGYIHFSSELPSEFYKQLTAEKKTRRYVKGYPIYEYVIAKAGARNEALDCVVYAEAAFYHLGLHRWRAAQWRQLEEKINPSTGDLFAESNPQPAEINKHVEKSVRPSRKRKKQRRGSYADRLING